MRKEREKNDLDNKTWQKGKKVTDYKTWRKEKKKVTWIIKHDTEEKESDGLYKTRRKKSDPDLKHNRREKKKRHSSDYKT